MTQATLGYQLAFLLTLVGGPAASCHLEAGSGVPCLEADGRRNIRFIGITDAVRASYREPCEICFGPPEEVGRCAWRGFSWGDCAWLCRFCAEWARERLVA